MPDSIAGVEILRDVPLRTYATLRAGGKAEQFAIAETANDLAELTIQLQRTNKASTILGWGSNILPSDDGVPGLVVINNARRIVVAKTGEVLADAGCGFQELFLKAAQSNLGGLEFAVGIPGTVGGALVSNAGAYRSCVSEFLTGIEVVHDGERKWVEPGFMEFSYRDSLLRRSNPPAVTLLRIRMQLPIHDPQLIYEEAREYQRQRISKQPPPASAGSFFKNVTGTALAESLPTLPAGLRKAGIVPAGYLIESSGLKGHRIGGAMLGVRHANFILNVASASASDIRRLANHAKKVVKAKFDVELEEEVLYIGDWSQFEA